MSQLKALSFLTIGVLCLAVKSYSQESPQASFATSELSGKVWQKLRNKNQDISSDLVKKTAKYLSKMSKLEASMKKKLAHKDASAAELIFGDVAQHYLHIADKTGDGKQYLERLSSTYAPHLDTLHTALKFIMTSNDMPLVKGESLAQIKEVIKSISEVEGKFKQAGEITRLIRQRKAYLQQQLAEFGLTQEVRKLTKHAYYYQAQVDEYRKILDDPSALEKKVITSIKQTRAFKEFFSKHAQLAGLFRLPDNSYINTAVDLEGLQTREGIGMEMIQRYGSGPDIEQMMKQSLAGAQSRLGLLKERINQAGATGSDVDLPDFKPNHQKTKRIRERLEFGTNLQTVKSSRYFPATSDVGLSMGYKLNNNSIVGVGGSYKIGWGKNIRQISITHQGIGFRSFFDYKIKGGFWASGGAELNYKTHFKDFEILNNYAAWQKSALLGVSKKYQVSKMFKGNIQLMYDLLWKQQVVRGQPVIFRIGYTF